MSVELKVLGELEVVRDGARLTMPQSKKTKALLAYLAVTGRPHRRERLCEMFWELADDPRGSLRWSLSKLRPLLDEPGDRHIVADRETVTLAGVAVDLLALEKAADAPLDAQVAALEACRGELLEGLDMLNLLDYQAWLVAQREDMRAKRIGLLDAVLGSSAGEEGALVRHARTRVNIDPYNGEARARFIRLLHSAGHGDEAEEQYRAGCRLLAEVGATTTPIDTTWQEIRRPTGAPALAPALTERPRAITEGFVGRVEELNSLLSILEGAGSRREARVVVIAGEPGIGKTSLVAELKSRAADQGATVLSGAAFEAESGRPYGPWVEALREIRAAAIGPALSADLAPLLPRLEKEPVQEHSRDRLYGGVVELLASLAHTAPPVVLSFDDIHWADGATCELLHYVVRMSRHRPLLVVLTARDGELPDNEAATGTLAALRREGLLDEIMLGPFTQAESNALIAGLPTEDLQRVFHQSAGNPLFAIQLAHAVSEHAGTGDSVAQTVRDRLDRLPPFAGDVLRWAAALGQAFSSDVLRNVVGGDDEEFVATLELLGRHGLIRETGDRNGRYVFAHDIVRAAVYDQLSGPRRRLIHLKIAKFLEANAEGESDSASDIARHAALAGENGMAARACVHAGRRYLRQFAGTEADAVAKRGLRYAEALSEQKRIKITLRLLAIRHQAHRPSDPEAAAAEIKTLAERALDLGLLDTARAGFHFLSDLRWEVGDMTSAGTYIRRAEFLSRTGNDNARIVGLGEAARCLVLLDRDLPDAEAMLLEARALAQRAGIEHESLEDAQGLLSQFHGDVEGASQGFGKARDLSRRNGNRLYEFYALEHLVIAEMERGRRDSARALCAELEQLGEKLRDGSELPMARALAALCRYNHDESEVTEADLAACTDALRLTDAKHRLSVVLTASSRIHFERGRPAQARILGEEALSCVRHLERPNDIARILSFLVQACTAQGDDDAHDRYFDELLRLTQRPLSIQVKRLVDATLVAGQTGAEPESE
ncbi:MAG: AAA family ATPase [Proteobacteria bacterium]|nr:AAA family ATPase [Pseudomonadota bacterium]MDA1058894.1 AAA family ATPase [Pseudomonadota bacterium]